MFSQVVEMASLADFDILRDTRQDIRSLPWAQPSNREATNLYFGVKRANEEILRLNVEIRRLISYMFDSHCQLYIEIQARLFTDPNIAHELSIHWQLSQKIYMEIAEQLVKTSKLHGFSGSLLLGHRAGHQNVRKGGIPLPVWMTDVLGLVRDNSSTDDSNELDCEDDEQLCEFVEYVDNL